MHVSCIVTSHNFFYYPYALRWPISHKVPYCTVPTSPVATSSIYIQIPPTPPKHISQKDTESPLVRQYEVQISYSHKKTARYYLNTYYSCTVGLDKEWILISLDKVVFGWAVCVAVAQLSPGLMWTINTLFCMYLQPVTLCCDISAGLIRPTYL